MQLLENVFHVFNREHTHVATLFQLLLTGTEEYLTMQPPQLPTYENLQNITESRYEN